jgi:hypothetical protein
VLSKKPEKLVTCWVSGIQRKDERKSQLYKKKIPRNGNKIKMTKYKFKKKANRKNNMPQA